MSNSEEIQKIIESRNSLTKDLIQVRESLKSVEILLNQLRDLKSKIIGSNFNEVITSRISKVDLDILHQSVIQERLALDNFIRRFSRSKLQIAVVGQGRQGKSFLLQNLTGLTSSVIPDGDGDFCTGVVSRICHDLQKTEAEAELNYYSESAFLEDVITPYYKLLKLGQAPQTLTAFKMSSLEFPSYFEDHVDFEEYKTLFDQFYKEYYINVGRYEHCFQKSFSPPKVSKSEIKEYVTQKIDKDGNRIDVENLALKEVQITCSFGNIDIGEIAFIDLPGLGDARRGFLDLDRLVKSIREDVDFIFFVHLPDMGNWREEDINLFKAARDAFGDFQLNDFSYMVLNHYKERKNTQHCNRFKESIDSSKINVNRCLIIDFANKEEVREKLLKSVLTYFSENSASLNRKYIEICQRRLNSLKDSMHSSLININILPEEDDDHSLFMGLRDSLLREIKIGLEAKRSQFEETRSEIDQDFQNHIKIVIEKCRNGLDDVPSLSNLREERAIQESYKMAYYHYLINIRKTLSSYFSNLDKSLQARLEYAKAQIADELILRGKLSEIAPGKTGIDFLTAMAEMCEDLGTNANHLSKAFKSLCGYIVLENFIVRSKLQIHLDKLDPDATPDPISQEMTAYQAISYCLNNLEKFDTESGLSEKINALIDPNETVKVIASTMLLSFMKNIYLNESGVIGGILTSQTQGGIEEQILKSLTDLRELVIQNCEATLLKMGSEPNERAYAMVTEFTEKVTGEKVKREWEWFFWINRNKIWDEFKDPEKRRKIQRQWVDTTRQLDEIVNHPDTFQVFFKN